MKRIVALVAALMVALGIGVLAQATPASAAVSGGGCTPSGDRDGYNGWRASACISLNTSTQQAEWDGYVDVHGSHCYTLTLQLYYNGTRIISYPVGCSRSGHITLQKTPWRGTGTYESWLVITYDNGTTPFLWKSRKSYLT